MNPVLNILEPSGIRRFNALADATPGCIKLTLGEPDFDTPQPIRRALTRALEAGRTHYAPNRGTGELCRAIAQWETARGFAITPEQVLVTSGASGALFTALLGVLSPGDECIIPTPAFPLYETIVRIAGAKPVFLDTSAYGFQIPRRALEEAVTERTRAIVLCSPNNPTGCVYTAETVKNVAEILQNKSIFAICDNVYQALCDIPCPDVALEKRLGDQVLVCQSFSKPYAMTGWRVGYLAGPRPLLDKLVLLHAAQNASIATFLQDACLTALETDVSDMAASFARRREYVCARLEKMGLGCYKPQGAFYAFPDIRPYGLSSEEFCARAIREAGVALVPGSCFGTEGFVRVSCCVSQQDLETGMDRLEKFLGTL